MERKQIKILLTGSSGYIGDHIAKSLNKTFFVLKPGRQELNLLDENSTMNYLRKIPVDIVIHCAMVGGSRNEEYVKGMFYDNIRMFFNIVRCRRYFKRMINLGSGAAYDKRYPIRTVSEESLGMHIPTDEYGFYKYICSNYIATQSNIVDLRIFGMFGEGEDYRYRFISNALCRYISGLPITIRQNVYFDYMDIQDFVKIIDYFIRHEPRFSSYNIGTGKRIDLLHIAQMINSLDTKKSKILVKTKGYGNEYTCDVSRLKRELKTEYSVPLIASITRLYSWYKRKIRNISYRDL